MEQEQGMPAQGSAEFPVGEAAWGTDGKKLTDRTGPTWRGFVLAILAAVVLSVIATLLFGGSWSSYNLHPTAAVNSGGCGPGSPCCPPPDSEK